MMSCLSVLLLLTPLVSGMSCMHNQVRAVNTTPISGRYDSVTAGQYSLLNNLWGETDATSGSQTSQLTSMHDCTIAWKTNWTWTGGMYSVKSFANIQLNSGINQQLSAIFSMPSTWHWSQSSTGTVEADVAYDLFTSDTGGSNGNEIMIWLANFNWGPLAAQYNATGQPIPILEDISILDHTWDLYSGSNGFNQVYSFVLTSGTIKKFNGDVYKFLAYLIDNEHISSSQYLTTAQAGTEAASGTATFTTFAYSLSIN
ncbi:glycoside hydrolase family 12 protein [Suillus paluster]|uniref:glycoside hydrolase family 12 protein n=1 Tax=Suillus paluster TaxID=48578 RepID=UPI001B884EEA|nr:glycoside hydrolase family 12 protein [Suillus paluster]KAG1726546.1 glycoside hydrolase family 12 protein [Suillus paluster]